ncbi:MAG: hypothetical protein HY471_00460 [Candidatus Sungbacteria bacterium]|nr:hypothetical protein [Candidatus Sungbacteria bacterium]
MATVTLTAPNGAPVKIDPRNVIQILGAARTIIQLRSGHMPEVRESREEALDKITAPKKR